MRALPRAALALSLSSAASLFSGELPAQHLRPVVLVTGEVPEAEVRPLSLALSELLAPYGASLVVAASRSDAPSRAVATVVLRRDPRGLALELQGEGAIIEPARRPRRLAIRVVTALRGALEAPSAVVSPALPLPAPRALPTAPTPPGEAPRELDGVGVTERSIARRPARVQRRAGRARERGAPWFVDLGASLWWPLGVEAGWAGSLRVGSRVSGTARTGLVVALGVTAVPWRTIPLAQGSERLLQLPVHLEVAWRARRGPLELSLGGGFGVVYTAVGSGGENTTLAFGPGAVGDLAVRVAGPLSLVLRGEVFFMGRTTILGGDEIATTLASAGPLLASGELGVRVGFR